MLNFPSRASWTVRAGTRQTARQASQQEEAGQGGPPAVTLYRRVLQQDGGQLHQAGERGADVKVGAGAARCQGETVVGGTAGEPAAGEREASRLHSVSTDNKLQHLHRRGPILSSRMDELPCAMFAKGPARTNTEMGAVNISKLTCSGLRTG